MGGSTWYANDIDLNFETLLGRESTGREDVKHQRSGGRDRKLRNVRSTHNTFLPLMRYACIPRTLQVTLSSLPMAESACTETPLSSSGPDSRCYWEVGSTT